METETLLVDSETVRRNVEKSELVEMIEEAYVNEYRGDSHMPAREQIPTGDRSEILSMPARLSDGSVGMKWVSDFLDNETLPPVMGTVIYNDKETGKPIAIIDGTELTSIRTGCAATVGTKHLLDREPNSVGIIGLGSQSKEVLRFHGEMFDFDTVYASDIDDEVYREFRDLFEDEYDILRCDGVDCIENSDTVTTATPVTSPVLSSVDTDVHINALGADMPQKQEISTDVLTDSDVSLVTDNIKQSMAGGEFSQLMSEGVVDSSDVMELGHLLDNDGLMERIRSNMTVFDSTGVAVQDIVTARMVYKNLDENECDTFSFF